LTSLVLINLLIISVATVGVHLSLKKGFYLYSSVLIGISAPAVIIPILLVTIGYESWRIESVINPVIAFNLQLNYLSFLSVFLILIVFYNLIKKRERIRIEKFHTRSNALFFFIFLIIGVALYTIYIDLLGILNLSDHVRTEKYLVGQGLGFFESGINLIIISVIIAEFSKNSHLRYFGRLIGLTIIFWSILILGVRTYPGILIVSWLFIYIVKNKIKIFSIRKFLIFLLIIYLFNSIAFLRNFPREMWLENLNVIFSFNWPKIIGTLDHSNSYINFYEIVTLIKTEGNIGTYLKAFTNLIPSQIYNFGYSTPSEIFTSYLYPNIFEKGGRIASSLVGELWYFGGSITGPVIGGFFIGCFFLFIEVISHKSKSNKFLFVYVYLIFYTLFIERTGFYAFTKTFTNILILSAFAYLIYRIIITLLSPFIHKVIIDVK